MVKQETFDSTDTRAEGDNSEMGIDTQSYIIQQQQLPYQQDFEFGDEDGSNADVTDEPAPKRVKRASTLKKAPIEETEEIEDDLDAAMQITKAEDEDSEDLDQPDYVEAPVTSADDQPGPSGVGKAAVEAPLFDMADRFDTGVICPICSKIFYSKLKYRKHSYLHGENKYKCHYCPKTFLATYRLNLHVNLVHQKVKSFSCSVCDFKCSQQVSLDRHMIRIHTKEFPFKCDLCKTGYFTKKELDFHTQIKHEGLTFVCQICSKIFKHPGNLRTHLKTHDPNFIPPIVDCSDCNLTFRDKRSLNKHIQMKHSQGEYDFICDVCGKRLVSKAGILQHKRKHSGEKPHVCEECGKQFTERRFLLIHLRVHTKEKPFKCIHCEKCFTQKSSLNIHLRIHSGERPYKCDICLKKFISKTTLKSHNCKGPS